MQYQDYYEILGLERSATEQEVQKAYRRLAREYHPDLNRDAGAEETFKRIGEAYEVLGDTEKRRKYDQYGNAWKSAQSNGAPPPGWEQFDFDFGGGGRSTGESFDFGNSGFSSFFEMLFGEHAAAHRNRQRGDAHRTPGQTAIGRDREATLEVTLEELASGGEKRIELHDPDTGKRKSLMVKIPRGVRPGQRIRLPNQGEQGTAGRHGDLYLRLRLLPHPSLEIDGNDLLATLPITPWEAALGGTAEVQTLTEPVTIRLPPGSSSGRRIRLRGRGLTGANGPGDLMVELRIVLPEQVSDREKELYEELASESGFTPRSSAQVH